jgi:GNAT superfamily N-acetyltransferase
MRIRNAEARDADVIVEFNRRLAHETEGKALDVDVLTRGVHAVLRDPTRGHYFVAVDDVDVVLGQLMVTPEWSDWRDGFFWWIQSVYVHADARRRGVYAALHAHVLHAARAARDVVGVRLYVEPDNLQARTTYARLGMQKTYDVMEQPL